MADEKKFLPAYKVYSPQDLSKNWFIYWIDPVKGRQRKYGRINRHKTFDGRMKEAQEIIQRLQEKHLSAYKHPAHQRALDFLESRRALHKEKGYQTYRSIINVFFSHLEGKELNQASIKAFFAHLLNNRHRSTYNKYRQKVKQVLEAIGEGRHFFDIDQVREQHTPARYFQSYQIKRLKTHILQSNAELWVFIEFMFYGLLRPNEIRQLKVGDILLDEKQIIVRGEISKNGKTEYIVIPDPWYPSIKRLISEGSPGRYIFPAKNGKPYGVNTMAYRHRKALKALNFGPEYKLYSWKHTGAVHAIKAGISVKELQMQLRHHSLDQVDEYLRQLGVKDMNHLKENYPEI